MKENMGPQDLTEAYANQHKKDEENSEDLYSKLNKDRQEQEETMNSYGSEYKGREKEKEDESTEMNEYRKKEDEEKEKRAAKIKEDEAFRKSYTQQYGEENEEKAGTAEKNTEDKDGENSDVPPIDTEQKKSPKDSKENNSQSWWDERRRMQEKQMDTKRIEQRDKIIEANEREINILQAEKAKDREIIVAKDQEIKEKDIIIERTEKKLQEVTAKLDKMNDNLNKEEAKIVAEENQEKAHKILTAVKKFVNNPKVKAAIAVGLMGAAWTAGGGVPAILTFKSLFAAANIPIIPFHGASSVVAGAVGGAGGRWLLEKIGLVKNKKDAKELQKELIINVRGTSGDVNTGSVENSEIKNVEIKNNENATKPDDKKKDTNEENERKAKEDLNTRFDKIMNKPDDKEFDGKEIHELLEEIYETKEEYGPRSIKSISEEIHKYNDETRAKMIDALAEYAKSKDIKPSEVAVKKGFIKFDYDGCKPETKEWFEGKKDSK